MEGKPEVFLGDGRARAVHGERNRVFDEESNSAARMRLRSVIPEEEVTRERYSGVRDVLKEKSFCSADYVWFVVSIFKVLEYISKL